MINLVTVTYNLEQHLSRLQAESLQNYVEPLRHWIVVNEENVDVHAWYEYLKPYYKHHELHILPRRYLCADTRINTIRGWATQQLLKFLIGNIIKDDYILLDAKNFFIQRFDFSYFDNLIGSGFLEFFIEEGALETIEPVEFMARPMHTRNWKTTVEMYANRLNITEIPKYFLVPGTPFKVHHKLVSERIDMDRYFDDLLMYTHEGETKEIACPSEFLYYSLAVNDLIKPGENTLKVSEGIFNHTLFPEGFDDDQGVIASGHLFNHEDSELNTNKDIKMFGLHRRFLEKCGPQHYREINYWLSNKGFKFQFS
jgi:hypothetical protein